MLLNNSEKFLDVLPDLAKELKEYHETANSLNNLLDYEDLVLKVLFLLQTGVGETLTSDVDLLVKINEMSQREMKEKRNK